MPGVVNTTHTFATNEVITSTLMNNIIDQTLFTIDAVDGGGTLTVTGAGKLKVSTSGITSNEIGANAVTANAILNGVITNDKISASAGIALSKLAVGALPTDITVTTANIVDASITTAKIADANVTAPKLNGAQTGSAPVYGTRAWVTFNSSTSSDLSGNYSRSGTTITITASNHGLIAGNIIFIDYTAGVGTVAPDGVYEVASVINANTFTVTSAASVTGTHTGTADLKRKTILASGNVSCVSASRSTFTVPPTSSVSPADGYYIVNLATAMSNANFSIVGNSNYSYSATSAYPHNAQSSRVFIYDAATNSPIDTAYNSFTIIG